MKYPIQRFIEHNLTVSATHFYHETRWNETLILEWRQAHTPVNELPIALLEDLHQYSSQQSDLLTILNKLQHYQQEYWEEVTLHRNNFCRIPNKNQLLYDLRQHTSENDHPALVQRITKALDERVFKDTFTVACDWDHRVISYVQQHCNTLPTILYSFRVKLLQLPNGENYPVYRYLGHELQEPRFRSLLQ